MSCTGVRQPVIMVSRANDHAVADRFREVLEHFKVIDDISPLVSLVLKVTFGFIRTALSILSKVDFRIYPKCLGKIEQPSICALMESDLVRSLSEVALKFNLTRLDQGWNFCGHLYIKWH